ncbi:DUF2861 family protein [Thaumasiovibrio sp. DFM-14]|uniref:DUF2861 family protein n=1 Tax=Thaumasiovibrio sp. DFM-14 TaxID=3384792 RepID=UPI0039A05BA0
MFRLLVVTAAFLSFFTNARWFEDQGPLATAHGLLLSGRVTASFEQMVQLWQQQPTLLIEENLDGLLSAAVAVDCGRSLDELLLPEWLPEISLQRETIQHVNQVNYSVNLKGVSTSSTLDVELVRWPDTSIVSGRTSVAKDGNFEMSFRHFSALLPRGLYQLKVTTSGEIPWITWVILGESESKQRISWVDSLSWRIDKDALPLKTCPASVLEQQIYPLDKLYQSVQWNLRHQGRLPTEFNPEDTELESGRYWLSVGLVETRWQGGLQLQEIQRLIKPVELHTPDKLDVSMF